MRRSIINIQYLIFSWHSVVAFDNDTDTESSHSYNVILTKILVNVIEYI